MCQLAVTHLIPQVADSEQSLVCRVLVKEFPRGQHLNRGEESRSGQREKLSCNADPIPMTASANSRELRC